MSGRAMVLAMNRVAPLASISIDCPDPDALAPFYCELVGLEEAFATRTAVSFVSQARGR